MMPARLAGRGDIGGESGALACNNEASGARSSAVRAADSLHFTDIQNESSLELRQHK